MEFEHNGFPRVVITGMGAITPLGPLPQYWENLINGCSGIKKIETADVSNVPVQIAGEIRHFDTQNVIPAKEARRMGRAAQFAVMAAHHAAADANLPTEDLAGERVGVCLGTTLGPHMIAERTTRQFKMSGYKRPNPLAFINCLPNMPAHHVSRYLGAFGPLSTPSAACASGTQAIGDALDTLRLRRADVVFAGGVEAIIQDYVIAGFNSMNGLATGYNDNPAAASRPFDASRSGFVVSEGAGFVVMETLRHAHGRGARIYAEVLGYGVSSEAYHVAALDPDARGAARSMQWALDDAGIAPKQVGHINAHGTSTPANDAMETQAIKSVFGDHAHKLSITANKSMIRHLLGSAGAVDVIPALKSLVQQIAPPTINYETPDPACDLNYTPNTARELRDVNVILKNSFGLGGQNASLVLAKLGARL